MAGAGLYLGCRLNGRGRSDLGRGGGCGCCWSRRGCKGRSGPRTSASSPVYRRNGLLRGGHASSSSWKETPTRAQKERRRERIQGAADALCILNWEIGVYRYVMLNEWLTKRGVSRRSKNVRVVVNRWHSMVRLYPSETRAASHRASNNAHEAR